MPGLKSWPLEYMTIPVAYSMVELANTTENSLQRYMCYWIAFNNIYEVIARGEVVDIPSRPPAIPRRDGSKTEDVNRAGANRQKKGKEAQKIDRARLLFSPELDHALIQHKSIAFFVERIPRFQFRAVDCDATGEKLNGVIKVGSTRDWTEPKWSGISRHLYARYLEGDRPDDVVGTLVEEIVDLLYTVRNNLFHGGKRADDANDWDVVRNAVPLLRMIVESFLDVE